MLRCLHKNLGTYKLFLLLILTPSFWFIAITRALDDNLPDALSGMATGFGLAILLVPIVRVKRYRLLYHRLIFFLGLLIVGSAMASRFMSPDIRERGIGILCLCAGLYLHSALWVYGRYDLSSCAR